MKKISDNILKKNAGFSLMEVGVVLGIFAVIAMISFPVYLQLKPRMNLNSVTRKVASNLRYAQQLAVTQQNSFMVTFDIAGNNYTIFNQTSSTTIKTVNINPTISIDSVNNLTNDSVNFNATGAATENGDIVLINSQNNITTVEIKPSGYVKIHN